MACPGPLMALIGAVREATLGEVIEVLSTEEGSKTDIPAWLSKAKHELISCVEEDGFTRFTVRKAR